MDDKKATKNPLGDLLRSLPPGQAAAAFMGAMDALEKAKTVTTTAKERVIEVEPKDGCADCPLRTHWMCNVDNAIANDEMQGESLPLSCPLRGTAGVLVRAKA